MDPQLKKGLLEACVLAVVAKSDSYGYKLVKDISEYIEITESTLYPILKRLENNNMLTVYKMEYNGRLRKYYRITEEGIKRIEEFKEEWQEVMKVYRFVINN